MTSSVAFRALAAWAGLLVLALANGALREAVLVPRLGQANGYLLSGTLLSLLILAATFAALPWLGTRRSVHLWGIGFAWLALTLVFEFSMGLGQGQSLARLLEAYAFKDGNIWPVVLAVITAAPWLASKLGARSRTTLPR